MLFAGTGNRRHLKVEDFVKLFGGHGSPKLRRQVMRL